MHIRYENWSCLNVRNKQGQRTPTDVHTSFVTIMMLQLQSLSLDILCIICTVKFWHPKICCNHPKIWTGWSCHRIMSSKDTDGMANSVDRVTLIRLLLELIWVYTACQDLSVQTFRNITVSLYSWSCVSLYPRHLCWGVYSFCLSVRLFVHSYVRSLVNSFVIPSPSWNYFKVLR